MKQLAVVDYGAGNIQSVCNALTYLDYKPFLVADEKQFLSLNPDRVILPGVGDGSYMMDELIKRGIVSALHKWLVKERPLLGICVGAQVLLSFTEESTSSQPKKCLNFIEGGCKRFVTTENDKKHLKIPHMGWNEVVPVDNTHSLFNGIGQSTDFYFAHSYYLDVKQKEHCIAHTEYGVSFASVIGKHNIFGTQFHPEKSGKNGLKLISNFLHM